MVAYSCVSWYGVCTRIGFRVVEQGFPRELGMFVRDATVLATQRVYPGSGALIRLCFHAGQPLLV